MSAAPTEVVSLAAEVLGVDLVNLTRGDVTRSFRRQAFATHPDTGGHSDAFATLRLARNILENHLAGAPWRAALAPDPLGALVDVRG